MSERIVSVWPGDRGFLQVAQLLLQALGEELLVEAGGWGLVGHGLVTRSRECPQW
jgi:hypothetical protein